MYLFFLARPISLLLKKSSQKRSDSSCQVSAEGEIFTNGHLSPKKWCSPLAVGAAPRTINYVNIGRYRSEECSSFRPPPLVESGGDPSSRSCVALPALSVITPWGVGEWGGGKEVP